MTIEGGRVILLGDVHGNFKDVRDLVTYYKSGSRPLGETDTIILLGDVGANFFFNHRDESFKKKLNNYGVNLFCIRGNHEQRPSLIKEQEPDKWKTDLYFGSPVYVEKEYPFIKYAMDFPCVYNIAGYVTLVIPGAYSVDKWHRLANGWSWFEQEQLNEDERQLGRYLMQSYEHIDMILSHTCPVSYEPTDLFLSMVDQSTVDKTMERYLEEIEYMFKGSLWCFGHYHATRIYPNIENKDHVMLFNDIAFDLQQYQDTKNPYEALVYFHIGDNSYSPCRNEGV